VSKRPQIDGLDNLLTAAKDGKVSNETLLRWIIDQNKSLKAKLEGLQAAHNKLTDEHRVLCDALDSTQAKLRLMESRQKELRDRMAHAGLREHHLPDAASNEIDANFDS